MPAKNPRLTITLQPSRRSASQALRVDRQQSKLLIGELLEGSGPVFDRMIQVMEAAKTAKESMRGRIAGDIEQAQARLEGLGMALEGFDQWTGSLLDEAEAVTRRGWASGRRTPRRVSANISNRGSGTTRKLQNIAQSRLKVRPEAQKVREKNRGVVMVRFDAYTATMKGPKPDDLMQILFDQVGTAAGFSKTRASTPSVSASPSRMAAGMSSGPSSGAAARKTGSCSRSRRALTEGRRGP